MQTETRFLVVRHAIPDYSKDLGNPGIDIDKERQNIDGTAWVISTILDDSNSKWLAIFSSPKRRAMETAIALSDTSHLRELVDGSVMVESILDDRPIDAVDYPKWRKVLPNIASVAISHTTGTEMPTILLVTHEPVIRTIPHLPYPNTNHLGVNEFTVSID